MGRFLIITSLLILGASEVSAAEIKCDAGETPRIVSVPSKSDIKYDFSKTKADLREFDVDTISPYAVGTKTHVGGLMSGEISLENQIAFVHQTYERAGQACLYINEIKVTFHVDPTIYVAKEFKPGTCEHKAVLDHEKKHILVDRMMVNKYNERISKTLTYAINKYGYSFGPFPMEQLEPAQKKMQDYIEGIIREESERMNKERRARQQDVDTLEEYERVSSLCR